MRRKCFKSGIDRDAHIIVTFGQARLVRLMNGRLELRGGLPADRTDAKEYISLFMHDAVPLVRSHG